MSLSPIGVTSAAWDQSLRRAADVDSLESSNRSDAARKLEGMFASMMLKTMRQTVDGDGLFPGDSSDALGSLFDQYLGDHLAEAGGLGVSRLLGSEFNNERNL